MPIGERPGRRSDAILMETAVLLSIYNALIAHKAYAWEVSQTDLAAYLQVGERTVQRITKRLTELNRLNRENGQGRSTYIYSVPQNAIPETMIDLMINHGLYLTTTPEGFFYVDKFENFLSCFGLDSDTEK